MKGNFICTKKESNLSSFQGASISEIPLYAIIIFLMLFHLGCENNKNSLDTAINEVRENCIELLSSDPDDKWQINNAEYGLDKKWHYEFNEEKVRVLYNKSFFFLIQKEATFSNTSDSKSRKHIRTIYSCSGVPQHLTAIERTYFLEDQYGKIELEKTEVLEGGELVIAPTEEDTFFDVLQRQEINEKKRTSQ